MLFPATVEVRRAPLRTGRVSPMQEAVAVLAAIGLTNDEIADALSVGEAAVRFHLKALARKIDSDLPAKQRVVAWVRGATPEVLTGSGLKASVATRVVASTNGNGRG